MFRIINSEGEKSLVGVSGVDGWSFSTDSFALSVGCSIISYKSEDDVEKFYP